jgi:hypothetical protein
MIEIKMNGNGTTEENVRKCLTVLLGTREAEQPWSRAISKAVEKQHKRIIDFADRVMLYANIDNLSSELLDIIAVEMKVQAYSESYNISLKRTLIKGAITYWSKAGTKKAVLIWTDLCLCLFFSAIFYILL